METPNKTHFPLILTYCVSGLLFFGVFIFSYQANAQKIDSDQDGISDYEEYYVYYTNPFSSDTDKDGFTDKEEILNGYSPRHSGAVSLKNVDSDLDGLNDDWEIKIGTDSLNNDSDSDGYSDGEEVMNGYDPKSNSTEKIQKLITIHLNEQRLSYFFDSTLLDSFLISSGITTMETPKGEFSVLKKIPSKRYRGWDYDYPNTLWNLHFTTGRLGYYIHGAYWHDKFGQPMSHGCVNVSYNDMERLYKFSEIGTPVKIF